MPVADSFDASFAFTVARYGAAPANGIGFAFVLHDDATQPAPLGSAGSAGVAGLCAACATVAVRFDTEGSNAVSVHGGAGVASADAGAALASQSKMGVGAIDDGSPHTARIWYNGLSKRLSVYLDGGTDALLVVTVDMDATFGGRPVWAGFTASTGMVYASTVRVTAFAFGAVATAPARCAIVEDGRTVGLAGAPVALLLAARDSCGAPRREGGDAWEVRAVPSAALAAGEPAAAAAAVAAAVVDNANGQYGVAFTPAVGGAHAVQGRLAANQPFVALGTVSIK